jgi:hypothetical protein
MSEEYQPDVILNQRKESQKANKPAVNVDKPIAIRVQKTRPNTQTKHYARKPRRAGVEVPDPRNVKFF